MLVAARIGVALDVQHDPAGLRVSVALVVPLDGLGIGFVRRESPPRVAGPISNPGREMNSKAESKWRILWAPLEL